jgi:hypothetical protein
VPAALCRRRTCNAQPNSGLTLAPTKPTHQLYIVTHIVSDRWLTHKLKAGYFVPHIVRLVLDVMQSFSDAQALTRCQLGKRTVKFEVNNIFRLRPGSADWTTTLGEGENMFSFV